MGAANCEPLQIGATGLRLQQIDGPAEASTWPGQMYIWVEQVQETWKRCRSMDDEVVESAVCCHDERAADALVLRDPGTQNAVVVNQAPKGYTKSLRQALGKKVEASNVVCLMDLLCLVPVGCSAQLVGFYQRFLSCQVTKSNEGYRDFLRQTFTFKDDEAAIWSGSSSASSASREVCFYVASAAKFRIAFSKCFQAGLVSTEWQAVERLGEFSFDRCVDASGGTILELRHVIRSPCHADCAVTPVVTWISDEEGALLQMLSVAGAGKWRASLGHLAGLKGFASTILGNFAMAPCEQVRQWREALWVSSSLAEAGLEVDAKTFGLALGSLQVPHQWARSLILMAELPNKRLAMNDVHLGAALATAQASQQWPVAVALLKASGEHRLRCEEPAYGAALQSTGPRWWASLALAEDMSLSLQVRSTSLPLLEVKSDALLQLSRLGEWRRTFTEAWAVCDRGELPPRLAKPQLEQLDRGAEGSPNDSKSCGVGHCRVTEGVADSPT
eukprot:g14008.t1